MYGLNHGDGPDAGHWSAGEVGAKGRHAHDFPTVAFEVSFEPRTGLATIIIAIDDQLMVRKIEHVSSIVDAYNRALEIAEARQGTADAASGRLVRPGP